MYMPPQDQVSHEKAHRVMQSLWQANRAATMAELEIAESALSSSDATERVAACIVVMLAKSDHVPLEIVCGKLRELCQVITNEPANLFFLLTSAIVMLPDEFVRREPMLRRFGYRAILCDNVDARLSATLLLGRLAKANDKLSVELLKLASFDEDEKVASNARTLLGNLGNPASPGIAGET
jgi:hypothetical protein